MFCGNDPQGNYIEAVGPYNSIRGRSLPGRGLEQQVDGTV